MMFQRAVTPDIEIRQFQDPDADTIFAAVERNREYLRQWLPWVDRTRSPEDIRPFISRSAAQFDAGQGPNAGIWIAGSLAGGIGVHPIDWANRNCSIGYWIEAAQQGKGAVTRCCEILLDYLFRELALHRVEIRCGTGNTRSCAIPQRLGFTRESVAREAEWVNDRWVDLVVWSLLEAEWRKRR
jgi:ribosomal-protein-serine acetyltransferase